MDAVGVMHHLGVGKRFYEGHSARHYHLDSFFPFHKTLSVTSEYVADACCVIIAAWCNHRCMVRYGVSFRKPE